MNSIPTEMRAFVLTGHGDLSKLEYHTDWPTPTPKSNEVLVQVKACGLNNTDINTRTGWYSKSVTGQTSSDGYKNTEDFDAAWGGSSIQFPRIQGADIAGIVVQIGGSANGDLLGKRVLIDAWLRDWDDPTDYYQYGYLGSEADGGYAEYVAIDERHIHPIKSNLSDAELATFATAYGTAENMLDRISVDSSDTVLITGASGGVGSALIQLANRRGATTIAMTSSSKYDQVQEIGPNAIISRNPKNLQSELQKAIGQDCVSVIADVVGGDYWPTLIETIQRGGRYVCSGAIAGPIISADLRTIYLNDLTLCGSTTPKSHTFGNMVKYIERSEIRPLLSKAFPLHQLHDAQKAFVEKAFTGKIVVTMDD